MSDDGDSEQAREEFRTLYDAKYRYVFAYALRRTLSEASAQDVVADTFLVAWRRLPNVPTGDETLPWLYGVARRVLANQRRGDARQSHLVQRIGDNEHIASAGDVEHTVMVIESGRETVAALRMLDPDEQELLCLVAWEELSHRRIAGMLECSENAVAIRVHRARTKLRRHMETLKGRPKVGHIGTKAALVEGDAS